MPLEDSFKKDIIGSSTDPELAQRALALVERLISVDPQKPFPLAEASAVDIDDLKHLFACATGFKTELMSVVTVSVREVKEGGAVGATVNDLIRLSAAEDAFYCGYGSRPYRDQVAGILGKEHASRVYEHVMYDVLPWGGLKPSLHKAMDNPGLWNFLACVDYEVNMVFACALANAMLAETAKPRQVATQGYDTFSRLARHILNGAVPLGWTSENRSWRPRTTWYVLVA